MTAPSPKAALDRACLGSSTQSELLQELIRRVARVDVPVLITGESGTGKELIARCIHTQSDKSFGPFIAVPCGAIPETLFESELFGFERGAFTGATERRKGYLEQSAGGTVFFDEIGELSQFLQVKLLRLLQEREFRRLGSGAVIRLQARLEFATHRNLEHMVESGTFRQDLYYRLNIMNIKVPPLRARTEDIPQLAAHFLGQYAARYGKASSAVLPEAMALLMGYSWPGNIRELENAIQRAIVLCDGGNIGPEHLPAMLQSTGTPSAGSLQGASFEEQLRNYKLQVATKAIDDCHGSKTLAARSLQISRTHLHRLMRLASNRRSM